MSNLKFENATPSKLVKVAATFAQTGTMYVKAAKVLAVAAVLTGSPIDDVIVKTGLAKSALTRPVAIVRNGDGDSIERTPLKVSTALHDLFKGHGVALLGDNADARYDAVIEAAALWDDLLSDQSAKEPVKRDPNAAPTAEEIASFGKRMSRSDLAILIHDVLVLHSDEAEIWTDAINDAIATAAATILGAGETVEEITA